MTNYEHIACEIIKYQEGIIGPAAVLLAKQAEGIKIADTKNMSVSITGDQKEAIDSLVSKYVYLWGKLGKEFCMEATSKAIWLLKPAEVPNSLKK